MKRAREARTALSQLEAAAACHYEEYNAGDRTTARNQAKVVRAALTELEQLRQERYDDSWVLCGNCGRNYNKMDRGAEAKHGHGVCGPR